jgi:hypothetical protein
LSSLNTLNDAKKRPIWKRPSFKTASARLRTSRWLHSTPTAATLSPMIARMQTATSSQSNVLPQWNAARQSRKSDVCSRISLGSRFYSPEAVALRKPRTKRNTRTTSGAGSRIPLPPFLCQGPHRDFLYAASLNRLRPHTAEAGRSVARQSPAKSQPNREGARVRAGARNFLAACDRQSPVFFTNTAEVVRSLRGVFTVGFRNSEFGFPALIPWLNRRF